MTAYDYVLLGCMGIGHIGALHFFFTAAHNDEKRLREQQRAVGVVVLINIIVPYMIGGGHLFLDLLPSFWTIVVYPISSIAQLGFLAIAPIAPAPSS